MAPERTEPSEFDRLLGQLGLPPAVARRAADRLNARLAAEFDVVVCATAFAQAEFDRIGAPTHRVPFGVDLDTFRPSRRDPRLRDELAAGAEVDAAEVEGPAAWLFGL